MSPKYHTKHGAKLIELRRVAAELERQAKKRATESGLKEAEKEPMASEPKKKITHERGGRLGEKVVDIIRAKLLLDFEATEDELVGIVRHMGGDPKHLSCRAQLKRLRDNQSGARYMDYWRNYFEILAGVRQLPTVSVPRVEPCTVEAEPDSGVFETQPESSVSTALVPVVFDNDVLEATRSGSSVWVSVLRVCDALGVDIEGQRKKLKDCPWAITEMISAVAKDGKNREVFCIDLKSLPMWLAGIHASKVAEPVRAKLLTYQVECRDALARHFGIAVDSPVSAQVAPSLNYRELANVVGMAVAAAMTPIVAQLRPKRSYHRPSAAQVVIPQTDPPLSTPVAESMAELRPHEVMRFAEQDQATDRKVLSVMIKRLAGVVKGMPTVEYGARMSVAYHQIEDELVKYGHDMQADSREANRDGNRLNSLDWFEEKGIIKLVMRIVEGLYSAKMVAKSP